MDNNESLAAVYQANVMQIIIVLPYIWKHYPNGDWFVIREFKELHK